MRYAYYVVDGDRIILFDKEGNEIETFSIDDLLFIAKDWLESKEDLKD